jgi:hypothetical protein
MTETHTRREPAVTLRRDVAFQPSTFDAESRTVEVIFTTGADVMRRDYWTGESWIERLRVTEEAVDLSRLNAGAPVLNSHQSYDLSNVVGVVERAWIANGEGRALLRFSDRPEVAGVVADVQAGILRNISAGYWVETWNVTEGKGTPTVKEAIRWMPGELSLVPVPADAGAQVRAVPATDSTRDRAAAHSQEVRMDETTPGGTPPVLETRAAPPAPPAPATLEQIQGVATRGGLDSDFIVRQLAAKATLDQVRDAAIDAVAAARAPVQTATVRVGASGDDPAAILRSMSLALAVRSMPALASSEEAQQDTRWRTYAELRPSDMLIELAQARGERVGPRDRLALIARSFHSSSDFPLLLEAAGNKMLMAGYAAAAPSYRTFFAQRAFNDFKAHRFLTAGDFPAPQLLAEGGEIKAGTISEKRESITPQTYARQVRVTRQMMVNDDLGAFAEFGTMIGRRVADFENALAYALVNTASGDGPTLVTGAAAVFGTGATRANKAGTGGAITEATLDAGYAAMMAQSSLDGIRLNLQPRILLTGPAYRGPALRFTTRITADNGPNVGLYSDLTPVADANIPGNRWYMFADPAAAPVYVYGYVNGQTAPMVRVYDTVPGTDGIAVEVVHDFAVGAVDHRGGYFNAGA